MLKVKMIVVGLDIGIMKIVCFVGMKNEYGKIEIIFMGKSELFGVFCGIVLNIEKIVQFIKLVIEEVQNCVENEFIICIVNVGIVGQYIKSLQY